jgi:NAD+ diphosphatase
MMPFTAPESYVGGVIAAGEPDAESLCFVFQQTLLLVAGEPPGLHLPAHWELANLGRAPLRRLYLGTLGERACYAFEYGADTEAPPGMAWQGLRALYGRLDDSLFALAGRALQFIDWDRTHQFCGRCGTPTRHRAGERARECPACKLVAYPRIAPAVMCLIRRGREILLARSPHFPPGMYSALAGFVEPGESLEQCLAREVLEETGVRIASPRYFASQPWPFPHSLMIAFAADYAGGELTPAPDEIEDAQWFSIDALPRLPSKISIARRLIDGVVAGMRAS